MDLKKSLLVLWNYLSSVYKMDRIVEGFNEALPGFVFPVDSLMSGSIEELSDKEAGTLFFNLGYMAVNTLFGGDWDTWVDVLSEDLEFDSDVISFLSF